MWNDILEASHRDGGHFIGSIVYVDAETNSATFQSWLVIDGQQRLTSLTLLLAALRDHISETGWSGTEDSPTVDRVNASFLKNMHETGNRNYKLALRRADNDTLRALVDGKDRFEDHPRSLLIENYECFRNHLRDPGCDLDAIYRGICRLNVVDVTLERRLDDPQLIFESMNSTGVDLSQSDLVRNYLLMGLDEAQQTQLYNEYWSRIEDLFKASGDGFDSFLRDYIALRRKSTQQPRSNRIYEEFKAFRQQNVEESLETLLQDMARIARYYASFLGLAPVRPGRLSDAMSSMRKLATTQGPLVIRLYDIYEKEYLSEEDFVHAIALIESYILRRDVLGLPSRSYWRVFARVALDMESDLGSLRVALACLQDNNRFPGDDEFRRALEERNLYALRNSCKHILEGLENRGQREPSPTQDFSIEHIMPQDISGISEWREMLGNDWEAVHGEWLHRLGNLTLTAYNSEYSNKPFEDKKAMEGGFCQSAVRLNEYVRDQDEWTKTQMWERGADLARRALKIWPHHEADQTQLHEAKIRELRDRAAERTSDDLEMSDDVRRLLNSIQEMVRELGDVVEIVENKSVCCHGPGFFAELLPMSYYVRVILPLDFNEVDIPDGLDARDASGWKFVPNRVYTDCDLLIDIQREEEIAKATPIIRQAFDRQDP